jgi:hypothetical protein
MRLPKFCRITDRSAEGMSRRVAACVLLVDAVLVAALCVMFVLAAVMAVRP